MADTALAPKSSAAQRQIALGNKNGAKDKIITRQLKTVLNEWTEATDELGQKKRVRKLRLLADTIVNAALDAQPWACQMVLDRVEGKPRDHDTATNLGIHITVARFTDEAEPLTIENDDNPTISST